MTPDVQSFEITCWLIVLVLAIAAVFNEELKKPPSAPRRHIEPEDDFRW